MRKKFIFQILFASAAAQAAYSAEAALCRELRLSSAEVFFESITYELRKDPGARKALAALPEGRPGPLLAGPAADDAVTQAGLFDAAAALIPLDGMETAARAKAAAAIAEARTHIAPAPARRLTPCFTSKARRRAPRRTRVW